MTIYIIYLIDEEFFDSLDSENKPDFIAYYPFASKQLSLSLHIMQRSFILIKNIVERGSSEKSLGAHYECECRCASFLLFVLWRFNS
jgi:hypothetical protein